MAPGMNMDESCRRAMSTAVMAMARMRYASSNRYSVSSGGCDRDGDRSYYCPMPNIRGRNNGLEPMTSISVMTATVPARVIPGHNLPRAEPDGQTLCLEPLQPPSTFPTPFAFGLFVHFQTA